MEGRKVYVALTILLSLALYGATLASGAMPEAKETVKLNFDNMPLQDWINQVAKMLGINYAIHPKVALTGPVRMYMTEPINQGDLFPIFEKVLLEHGAAIVKDKSIKNFYYIVPAEEASREPLPVQTIQPPAGNERKETVKLNFYNLPLANFVNQMAAILHINYSIEPKLATKGGVILYAPQIYKEELFRVFEQVLYMNNLAIVQDPKLERLYHISPRVEDEREIIKDGKRFIRTPFGDTPRDN